MKLSELTRKLGATVSSLDVDATNDPEIQGVAAVDEATSGTISYIEGAKFASQIATTAASALILPSNSSLQAQVTDRGIAWIEARDPRLVFAQTIALFYQPFKPAPAIHPTAVIDPTATLGEAVHVGAHVVIQANVKIGNGVCIHPNVVVYPDVTIGDRTVLHANCVIHERSKIGADCVIHAGAVIGSEGFGFVPTREGWYKMEQSGYTVLEDGVEVGCNSAVDRPAVGETRIGRNTKLDNMVQVGHGCHIGEACALAAQIGLAGGVKIGNRVIMGGQVGVANQAKIGDGVQVGAQAGLHGNVQPGEVIIGTPAVPYKTFLKVSAIYSRLPEMYKVVKELQKRFDFEKAESATQDKS
jgi:UDP-3-O-[3-hydroxymyristoyl] glucosamine N-acyltransferase